MICKTQLTIARPLYAANRHPQSRLYVLTVRLTDNFLSMFYVGEHIQSAATDTVPHTLLQTSTYQPISGYSGSWLQTAEYPAPGVQDFVCGFIRLRKITWPNGHSWWRSINTRNPKQRYWRCTSEARAAALLRQPECVTT